MQKHYVVSVLKLSASERFPFKYVAMADLLSNFGLNISFPIS